MKSKHSPYRYDDAFKREAVRLVEEEGRSAHSVERELGLGNGAISRWRKAFSLILEQSFSGHEQNKAELRLLQRENEILRQERDILKKAMAIFSKTSK
jgi:transposase